MKYFIIFFIALFVALSCKKKISEPNYIPNQNEKQDTIYSYFRMFYVTYRASCDTGSVYYNHFGDCGDEWLRPVFDYIEDTLFLGFPKKDNYCSNHISLRLKNWCHREQYVYFSGYIYPYDSANKEIIQSPRYFHLTDTLDPFVWQSTNGRYSPDSLVLSIPVKFIE